ncbi:YveK family protein [Halobacillus andaensis]|nr:Wzz/FepE/Etk N-terminal domain-containing protein [Halobacillus andaensis]MBP2005806.1 capsular polysaccharide biosynthesis protein [Halobacillus andaensis]
MEEGMDIKRFFRVLRQRLLTIAIVTLCVFLISVAGVIFILKPSYESMENIVVGKLDKENMEYGSTQELNMLLASTMDLIKSPTVLNSVKADFNYTYEELEEKIVVQNSKDSQIVKVVARGNEPEETRELAHLVALTTVNKMNELLNVKDIIVLSDPDDNPPVDKVGSVELSLAIGMAIGLLLGVGGAFLREYFDDTIRSSREIESQLGIRVLGEVTFKKTSSKWSSSRWKKKEIVNQDEEETLRSQRGEIHVQEH